MNAKLRLHGEDDTAPGPGHDAVARIAHVGTFRWESADDRMTWSEEVFRIFGLEADQFDGTLAGMLSYAHEEDRDRVKELLDRSIKERESFRLKQRIRRPDGAIRSIECVGVVDVDARSRLVGLHGVCVDTTEQMGEGIETGNDDPFRLLVERVRDYAIFMLDPTGRIVSWNEGAQHIKGYSAAEIIGDSIDRFYTPEDRKRGHPAELLGIAREQGRVEEEGWRVRKDGTRFWADVVITALRDDSGELRGYGKVTRDLSERREAELAVAELAGRLLGLQDDERRRIARELHDSTSPLLTGLIAKLYSAKQRSASLDSSLARVIDESLTSAEALSTVVRSVSSLLHPPLLEESGLLASLKWFANAFSGRQNIRVDLDFPPKVSRLPRDTEVALFRIVQESLNSVIGNVGSKRARIRVRANADELAIQVEGSGAPLPTDLLGEMKSGRGDIGIGVAGMRERLRQIGGKLELTAGGSDVSISAILPLKDWQPAGGGD